MKKQMLETFIKKYSLNGSIESVKFVVDSKQKLLKTSIVTEEKNVIGTVTMKNFDDITEDIEIGVYETSKLKQMLGVLGEDIKLSLNKNDKNDVTSLVISDGGTTVQFITAEKDIIAPVPNLKKLPDFNVEIEVNDEFVTKFVKAKNALPDESVFTVMNNKKGELTVTIGYSNINSNRITLTSKTLNGKDKVAKEINFNAKYFKEILTSNSDVSGVVYKISDAGLSTVSFSTTDFDSVYYIVETKRS